MRKLVFLVATSVLACSGSAFGALIASDSFITTATSTTGDYLAGNIGAQTATTGTTGYYTGASTGNPTFGWASGTGAVSAQVGGLTHPLVVNPPSANDGSLAALGNANTRIQYRDFAGNPASSPNFYFSTLLRESATSYTATAYVGISPSQTSGGNGVTLTTGFQIGYVNGVITLFYNNGGASYATESLLTPPAGVTYMAEIAVAGTGSGATITPTIYNSLGAIVNSPGTQAVTATVNLTDLGAFDVFDSSTLSGGIATASSTTVNPTFDEFRFGTAESDVVVPEPSSLAAVALATAIALIRRRRRLA